jgi:F0F1-type ATP synthase membrane subunit c/vacuolar-type H+-ATPase subunit K
MSDDSVKSPGRNNYIGAGLCIGIAIGIAISSIPLGMCLGLVFGVALDRRKLKEDA